MSLSFNKYLMSLVVVVNLVNEMKLRYHEVTGERLQKKSASDQISKKAGAAGDATTNNAGGLSRANAEFMTTIAGSLLGSLNIEVIMHFANAIRQLMEEDAENALE